MHQPKLFRLLAYLYLDLPLAEILCNPCKIDIHNIHKIILGS